jgi:hypothetical protein
MRTMAPKEIIPTGGIGEYNVFDSDSGAVIKGSYKLLKLAGARIYGGPLVASHDSSADNFLLSGADIPEGVLLGSMTCGRFAGQGIRSKDIILGPITAYADLSWIKARCVDLSFEDYSCDLNLSSAIVDILDFGNDINRRIETFDIRDAKITEVRGKFPARLGNLLRDGETEVPESFAKYLEEQSKASMP